MSSSFLTQSLTTEVFFRNANGIQLTLEEKTSSNLSNVDIINFALRSEKHFNVNLCLTLVCAILFIWFVSGASVPLIVLACLLILQCKSFVTSIKQDTLLVVKSVGVHIENKRGFGIFTSIEFLPWDTIEDIFINEVIKGTGFKKISSTISRSITRKKMPGIHIRTLSQFDWLDQEKESLLTIPGAYWLCHKKNIYKFIFRYHRTVKNTIQFSYGRELLKIVRKIIKCHPTQGQQFGTQHLLVTYNCTSWTRQDKMFAIKKFQQRTNAAAFSHAFVLTIRTFPSLEHSLFDLKYPIVKEADAGTTFKDLNISLDTEEKIISDVISVTNKESSRKDTTCHTREIHAKYAIEDMMLSKALETKINSFQDNTMESASLRENLDKRIENTTAQMQFVDKHNKEFHNDVQENKYIDCNTEGYEIKQNIDCVQEQSLKTNETNEIEKTQKMNEEVETESALIQKQNQQTQDIQKYKISSSLKSSLTGMITGSNNKCSLNKFNFDQKLIQKDDTCTIINKDNLNNNKKTISENINSNNVSHQNFIEKQIKNSKFNLIIDQPQKNLQTEIKNIDKDCVPKMIEENDKSIHINQEDHNETNLEFQENNRQCTKTSMDIDDKQSENHMHNKSYKTRKQKSRESEKKIIPDKVLRSSNITDLVMEGLMFTIRQDQDSVAVIEQKTKLEIDEVLENSEKVETKAGEKCLLNSSLLRLENLVTMIDSPRNKDEEHKNHHAIGNSANLSPFNVFPNDIYNDVYNVNINEVDTGMNESNVSNYDRHNMTKHINLYQSRWQHQRVSSKISNSSASRISIENREQLMEWQSSDNEQDKNYKNNIEIKKQEHYSWDNIPEISLSKKINGLQNTVSLINRNIEEIDKYDKSMEEQYSSNYSLNSSKMSTVSIISEDSDSIELSRREANAPRIVSNESITVEQMSPALQNVLRHRCRARRFSSTTSSGMFQQNEQKMQSVALTEDTISETDILEDKCTDSNIVNITINSKKINNNGKSCAMINKDASEMNRNTHEKNSKGKNGTRRTLRSSSSKHDSPRKLQDITEEFYYDLMHVHNKDNAIRKRCLRQKQKSLNNLDGIKSGKVRIEMLKFIQDITEGARVVVKRLNIDNKSNLLEKNSNLI